MSRRAFVRLAQRDTDAHIANLGARILLAVLRVTHVVPPLARVRFAIFLLIAQRAQCESAL